LKSGNPLVWQLYRATLIQCVHTGLYYEYVMAGLLTSSNHRTFHKSFKKGAFLRSENNDGGDGQQPKQQQQRQLLLIAASCYSCCCNNDQSRQSTFYLFLLKLGYLIYLSPNQTEAQMKFENSNMQRQSDRNNNNNI